jgi:hypothetical protein
MSDTNKYLLTIDDIFRMQGRRPGFVPTDLEYEQATKTINDLNKSKLESMMSPSQPQSVSFGSATNAEGRVFDYMVKPKGVDVQIMEPKVLNTQQGMFTQVNPTNVAPIVDPRTGQQVMGYAADPYAGSPAPAPMAGGGAFAGTNAPTASPTPQPAPTPSYTMTQAEASQRFGTNMPVGTHRVPKLGGVLVITP